MNFGNKIVGLTLILTSILICIFILKTLHICYLCATSTYCPTYPLFEGEQIDSDTFGRLYIKRFGFGMNYIEKCYYMVTALAIIPVTFAFKCFIWYAGTRFRMN